MNAHNGTIHVHVNSHAKISVGMATYIGTSYPLTVSCIV